jgi:hypothetical protein
LRHGASGNASAVPAAVLMSAAVAIIGGKKRSEKTRA